MFPLVLEATPLPAELSVARVRGISAAQGAWIPALQAVTHRLPTVNEKVTHIPEALFGGQVEVGNILPRPHLKSQWGSFPFGIPRGNKPVGLRRMA